MSSSPDQTQEAAQPKKRPKQAPTSPASPSGTTPAAEEQPSMLSVPVQMEQLNEIAAEFLKRVSALSEQVTEIHRQKITPPGSFLMEEHDTTLVFDIKLLDQNGTAFRVAGQASLSQLTEPGLLPNALESFQNALSSQVVRPLAVKLGAYLTKFAVREAPPDDVPVSPFASSPLLGLPVASTGALPATQHDLLEPQQGPELGGDAHQIVPPQPPQ